MRAYQLLAQGRLVIKALESVTAAGLNEQGLPKLAICRAHARECLCEMYTDGRAVMTHLDIYRHNNRADVIRFPENSFPHRTYTQVRQRWNRARAVMPLIPLHLRPKRGLANYHVLWEAEWEPVPPRDPFLLRRIGKGDMWLVVAAWDLTEVERAALAARIAA